MLQVQLRVAGRRCLVVGGGTVGTRRSRALLNAGADVVVVDPTPSAELEALAAPETRAVAPVAEPRLEWLELVRRPFRTSDVTDGPLVLVVAATDDAQVNAAVGSAAQQAGVLVNRADDVTAGDLAFPAVVRRGPVTIGISSAVDPAVGPAVEPSAVDPPVEPSALGPGAPSATNSHPKEPIPALSRWLAQQIDEGVDTLIGLDEAALTDLARLLVEVRNELRGGKRLGAAESAAPAGSESGMFRSAQREDDQSPQLGKIPETEPQKAFDWHSVFDESILELVQAGRLVEAKERIFACL